MMAAARRMHTPIKPNRQHAHQSGTGAAQWLTIRRRVRSGMADPATHLAMGWTMADR
jgi:hypothetical protein